VTAARRLFAADRFQVFVRRIPDLRGELRIFKPPVTVISRLADLLI